MSDPMSHAEPRVLGLRLKFAIIAQYLDTYVAPALTELPCGICRRSDLSRQRRCGVGARRAQACESAWLWAKSQFLRLKPCSVSCRFRRSSPCSRITEAASSRRCASCTLSPLRTYSRFAADPRTIW